MVNTNGRLFRAFLVAAAAVCAIAAVRLLLTYEVAGEAYRHVAKRVAVRNTAAEEDEKEMAGEKQPDGKPVTETAVTWECPIDFKALRGINDDARYWLRFDGELSGIDYPVVKSGTSKSDGFYLHHTVDGTYSFAGTLFISSFQEEPFINPRERNIIIYGHSMADGSMFGRLKDLGSQEFFDRNKTFWLYTEDTGYHFEIESFYVARDASDAYEHAFGTDKGFEEFRTRERGRSIVKADARTDAEPLMVSLSTCASLGGQDRYLAHAMCIERRSYRS